MSGFTLIELFISIGILTIIGTVGIVSFSRFRDRQMLDLTTNEIVTTLRRARTAAAAQENASAWGVHLENPNVGVDSYDLFYTSSTYASGTLMFRKRLGSGIDFSDPVASSTKDVIFNKATGLPQATSSIILQLLSDTSATKTITVNSQGEVSY
ncbi:MAG: hypothetical protein A3J67_05720 [Parcubacteria group bacterium RIFCSPHIGHO2_02_FULL_48_10b]|nr:MAG: hypothetical protein A3J67_05720 [Parcubacteria group bacterium RIFCSPHIGHO2_02_FULL_48_10b]